MSRAALKSRPIMVAPALAAAADPTVVRAVEFTVGQAVPWPRAPDGVAQVEELLRTNVGILYARRGRLCRARVAAAELARACAAAPLLPGVPDNPFRRAVVVVAGRRGRRRSKSFSR